MMTPNARRHRRGLVSVIALVALIIIGIVCAGLIKVALARRLAVRSDERRAQAAWLVESGLERASARLAASVDYAGETWETTTEELGGRGPGSVQILVETIADQPDRRKVRIVGDFPANSSNRSRESREFLVPISPNPR